MAIPKSKDVPVNPNPYKCPKCGRIVWYEDDSKTRPGLCSHKDAMVRMKRIDFGTYRMPRTDVIYTEVRWVPYDELWHTEWVAEKSGIKHHDRIQEVDVPLFIAWIKFKRGWKNHEKQ